MCYFADVEPLEIWDSGSTIWFAASSHDATTLDGERRVLIDDTHERMVREFDALKVKCGGRAGYGAFTADTCRMSSISTHEAKKRTLGNLAVGVAAAFVGFWGFGFSGGVRIWG